MGIRNQFGRALGVAAAGLALALAGCKSGYVADVRNDSGEPLYAQLVRAGGAGNNVVVAEERIPPGDRRGVAKYAVPDEWAMFLSIDTPGKGGPPQQVNLTPGTTIVTVTKDQSGRLRIDWVPRP
ncbi:MAG: hypothetical protein HEQ23_16275 [Tepidisphaera sp.]